MKIRPGLLMAALALAPALAGCVSGPSLNAGLSLSPSGLHVYPSVSARVGGARVAVSP